MCKVTIRVNGNTIHTSTPYDPAFVAACKRLNGTWHAATKTWRFDSRDEAAVREACIKAFGTDGSDTTTMELVDVRISLHNDGYGDELRMFGRCLARRPGRDCPVRLGEGVVIVAGGFAGSGGSARYPGLCPSPGTVLEVRDVPASLVTEQPLILSRREDGTYTHAQTGIEIVQRDEIDREALAAERERLLARIAEIDALLK